MLTDMDEDILGNVGSLKGVGWLKKMSLDDIV